MLGGVGMNWDAIGAVGEAIGAAGVIASLVYLAIQIRASTRASAVQAKLQATRLLSEVMDSLIQTPELNDLYLRGLADLGSLSKAWLRGPGLRAWWAKFGRASFGPEFQDFIEAEIAALDAA
jgi:hypothetical protein